MPRILVVAAAALAVAVLLVLAGLVVRGDEPGPPLGAVLDGSDRHALDAAPLRRGPDPPPVDPAVDLTDPAAVARAYLAAARSATPADHGHTRRDAVPYAAAGSPAAVGVVVLDPPPPGAGPDGRGHRARPRHRSGGRPAPRVPGHRRHVDRPREHRRHDRVRGARPATGWALAGRRRRTRSPRGGRLMHRSPRHDHPDRPARTDRAALPRHRHRRGRRGPRAGDRHTGRHGRRPGLGGNDDGDRGTPTPRLHPPARRRVRHSTSRTRRQNTKPSTARGPVDGTTAAATLGWGEPVRADEFDAGTGRWSVYDGPGHAGEGRRSPSAVSVRDGVLTITGDPSGTTAGMSWGDGRRYGRWEARVRAPGRRPDVQRAGAAVARRRELPRGRRDRLHGDRRPGPGRRWTCSCTTERTTSRNTEG